MGGRGSYSGKYKNTPRNVLQKALDRQEQIISSKKLLASLSLQAASPAVSRRVKLARTAIRKAQDEIKEIQTAMKYAKKIKDEPF